MPSDTQVGLHRHRAPLAERQVVFGRAALVAVALDGDHPRRILLQHAPRSPCTTARPASSRSALSSAKNTGLNGESRLRSSSDRLAMRVLACQRLAAAPAAPRRRAAAGAAAGVVAAGGVAAAAPAAPAAAAVLRACRCRQAEQDAAPRRRHRDRCISRLFLRASVMRIGPRTPIEFLPLVRPGGRVVVAVPRDLLDAAAVAADGEDLDAARARRREREVPAVRRIGRALVGAFAERDLPRRAGRQVVDLDVVARPGARRERDLVERRRRPGRPVGVRLGRRQPPQVQAVGADDVDLRRAGAIGRERDLRAGRRPGRRDVDRRDGS